MCVCMWGGEVEEVEEEEEEEERGRGERRGEVSYVY